jgi:hypothetical protein
MTPLRRMTRSRDGWKMKATERATELREQRKELLKARARHKEDKERIRKLEAQLTAPPPLFARIPEHCPIRRRALGSHPVRLACGEWSAPISRSPEGVGDLQSSGMGASFYLGNQLDVASWAQSLAGGCSH